MTLTRLQRLKNTKVERTVSGVRLVQSGVPEAQTPAVAVGGTVQMSARLYDKSGFDALDYYTAPTLAWDTADHAKATVDADTGLVTAVYTGSANTTVSVTCDATTAGGITKSGAATATITGDTTPASVDVSPATVTLAASATQQLTV